MPFASAGLCAKSNTVLGLQVVMCAYVVVQKHPSACLDTNLEHSNAILRRAVLGRSTSPKSDSLYRERKSKCHAVSVKPYATTAWIVFGTTNLMRPVARTYPQPT